MRTNFDGIKLPGLIEVTPRVTWSEMEQIEKSIKTLKEIASTVEKGTGNGITTLFTGENDKMKTVAAEILASKLDHRLFKIDLPLLVSKYIGETEKNLRKIFDSVENREIILFFDEEDALFGKRREVKDEHDQYVNSVYDYLLKRLESHDGIVVLATNHDVPDSTFVRRIKYQVDFPFPDSLSRRRDWKKKLYLK